ncbi:MAG: chorismate synthase [Planctomycetota bacterium]|jgi:chorismate synthase
MLRILTAGESHGAALVAIIEGLPAGLVIDEAGMRAELRRRQGGYGRGGRQKIETDSARVLTGVRGDRCIGSPLTLIIENKDTTLDRLPKVTRPRPGHADLSGALKYGADDARDILERASARETAIRVAAGHVCKQLLRAVNIEVFASVVALGGRDAAPFAGTLAERRAARDASEFYSTDPAADGKWKQMVDDARAAGDTLGGVIQCRVAGAPPGLGSHAHYDRKLDGRLAAACMSIQAMKGVEIGAGFGAAERPGSQVHDAIGYDAAAPWGFTRPTNNAGGLEGGITNGQDIVLRVAKKPISTLKKALPSVDLETKEPFEAAFERSDVCAVPAGSVIVEAVVATVMAEAVCEKFGGDSIAELTRNYDAYVAELRAR